MNHLTGKIRWGFWGKRQRLETTNTTTMTTNTDHKLTENKPEAGAEAIRQIHDFESSLDCCAHELLTHATHETRELYHAFSKALQTDLRAKFGDVFENFPQP